MLIRKIDIQNFRKLKCCSIEIDNEKTIFVGANNSGKTSGMDALIMFLKPSQRKRFSTTDFTLVNWRELNKIGEAWCDTSIEEVIPNTDIRIWQKYCPSIDVWLSAKNDEIHYVSNMLPSLDWNENELIGVRLSFEPKNIDELRSSFTKVKCDAKSKSTEKLHLWPKDLRDFLDRKLHTYFSVFAYPLDPDLNDEKTPQELPKFSERFGTSDKPQNPFKGLFKIDIINAQRGFSDDKSELNGPQPLSKQLREFYDRHLDPVKILEEKDIKALEAQESARDDFDLNLKEKFKESIEELSGLNYPGFSNPQIELRTKPNPIEGLSHESAVQFKLDQAADDLLLPEKYNGLGFQNLISMIFQLIAFRKDWIELPYNQIENLNDEEKREAIEPLHLVLIEEPEAHLHAQVQQIFVRKAFEVLRKNIPFREKFSTQLLISTHSSHITHNTDFTHLRYFKRLTPISESCLPCVEVVSMNKTFDSATDLNADVNTLKFVKRYLKLTHSDLFFADAAIIVEGSAERMLVPQFINYYFTEKNNKVLDKAYISVLEIGGSHAHKLLPLLKKLGIITLILTDLDSKGGDSEESSKTKCIPELDEDQVTSNSTLKEWFKTDKLDTIISASDDQKVKHEIRVAYPHHVCILFKDKEERAIPYTFEDALVLSNIEFFESLEGQKGLIKKMQEALKADALSDAIGKMFKALKSGDKAEMALELLFIDRPESLFPPKYIDEGLSWLDNQLNIDNKFHIVNDRGEGPNV